MRNVTTMFTNQPNRSKESGTYLQRGFSLIELLVVVAIILIIAAIAIPSLLNSRIAAIEASAAVTVHIITTASMTYSSTYGNDFPPNLATLGGPSAGPATCSQAVLLDELITTAPNTKSGFIFAFSPVGPLVTPPAGCGAAGSDAYLVTATPVTENLTGIRSFCSDELGTIHFDTSGATAAIQTACEALPAQQ